MSRYTQIALAGLLMLVTPLIANEHHNAAEQHTNSHAKERFKPKDFIFDHIKDAYSWHIFTFRSKHISIPLPVIVRSKHTGWHLFLSSNFHHGHAAYHGFEIAHSGVNAGKIVEKIAGSDEEIVPLDLSITKNVAATFASAIIMLWVFLSVAAAYRKRGMEAPRGAQSLFEPIILFIRDEVAKPAIGEHKYERFMPYLLTIFFFIWFNNLMGLIPFFPGGANVTGNISVTIALALFTFTIMLVSGNKHFWLEIFNAPGIPWWLKIPIPLIPVIELVGTLTKPFTLTVRLFANISAGHIIALAFFSLIFIFGEMSPGLGYATSLLSVLFTVFMAMLELLVALIQAYVFTLLSSLYFGMATAEHHEEH